MVFGPARQLAKDPPSAAPPFMEIASKVGHALPRLDSDLRASGFGSGSRGLAGELYASFIATIVGARGTEDEAWAWAIGRTLADDLAEIGARRGALALLDGLISFAVNHADQQTLQRLQQTREALSPDEAPQQQVGRRGLKLLAKPAATAPSAALPPSAGRQDRQVRESDAVAALRALIAPPEPSASEIPPPPLPAEAPPPPTEIAQTTSEVAPALPAEAGPEVAPAPVAEKTAEIELPAPAEAPVLPIPEPASDRAAPPNVPSTDGEETTASPGGRREPSLLLTSPASPVTPVSDIEPAEDRIWPALERGAKRSRTRRGGEFLLGAATALIVVGLLLLANRDPDLLPRSLSPDLLPRSLSTVKAAVASLFGASATSTPATAASTTGVPTNGTQAPAEPAQAPAKQAPASTNSASAPAMANAAADMSESPPSLGVGQLLSPKEVRYCVFQGRRLTYLRSQIHGDASVQRFNAMVADFNGRCGDFRYRTNELREATRKAEASLDQLEADANALASGSPTKFGPLVDLSTQQGAGAIQARLKALGFYDHRVDGVWGPNSAAALAAFREKRHLGSGAVWDLATQWAVLE
jgi:hypothetical protein